MVKQYPHTLEVLELTEATKDEDGNWIPGTEQWVNKGNCRLEVAKQNAFKTGEDGQQIYYFATVYAPLPKLDISAGTKIRVTIGTKVKSLDVKMADEGSQVNNRLWV